MINKHGVFTALVNTPVGKEQRTKERIEFIFEEYQKRLREFNTNCSEQNLFVPRFYALLGSYDLAVISQVDDFVFGYQKFNPNTTWGTTPNDSGIKSFNYHIYNCTSSSQPDYKYLYDEVLGIKVDNNSNTYPKQVEPFISITSFKIKSSLLIGSGTDVIEATKLAIAKDIDKYNQEITNACEKVKYLILDTTSWHEICLILTGSSLHRIGNVVYRVRETITLNDMKTNMMDEDILSNSLLFDWSSDKKVTSSNIFSTSNTYFGVQYELLSETDTGKFEYWLKEYILNEVELIGANTRISTIPTTHLQNDKQTVGGFDVGYILYNDADIEPTKYGNIEEPTIASMLRYYRANILCSNNNPIDAGKSIRKTHTTPKIKLNEDILFKGKSYLPENIGRANIGDLLDAKLPISIDEIAEIMQDLTALSISKAVRQRFLKILSNYNEIILDRLLYVYIIDMRLFISNMKGFLKKELNKLELEPEKKVDAHELIAKVNGFARLFERVYYNVIQHSLRAMDLTEFNLDFNGGIQQNLSVSNFVFGLFRNVIGFYQKDITEYLNDEQPIFHAPCVAYLSNASGIKSYEYSLQLNYFHITEPATFLVTIFKEVLNRKFQRMQHADFIGKTDDTIIGISTLYKRIIAWDERSVIEHMNKIKFSQLEEQERAKAKFDLIYHLFNEYPKTGSLRLQQDVLAAIQKTEISKNVEQLLRVYNYIQYIDEEIVHYILVDYNNFKWYYCEDAELYSNWYWIHFFQEPDVYRTNKGISSRMFSKAIFRMTMLYLIANIPNSKDGNLFLKSDAKKSIWYKKLIEYEPDLFEQHFDDSMTICRILYENDFLFGFLSFKSIAEYSLDIPDVLSLRDKEYENRCLVFFKEIFESGNASSENYIQIASHLNYLNKTTFKDNISWKVNQNNSAVNLFSNLRSTFMCYLSVLSQYIGNPIIRLGTDANTIQTGWVDKGSVQSGKIQPDPNGGFFATGNLKQHYFLANNYLFKILNNHTLICKMEHFKGDNKTQKIIRNENS